ncbi:MAG: segregation/condensation protein A [Methylacidiphilales bacterium]|nr:segregation/condensation protein A [Candidatus Methylacidiphilales bacterium]
MTFSSETPFAVIKGVPILEIPSDVYVPSEALQLTLDHFSGPMDLLMYLIKKQNIDILDIPVARIAEQYATYVKVMQTLKYELAGDYLLMAVLLAEIKTKMLLPKQIIDKEEVDPRSELVRRIIEYERYKTVAEYLGELPRLERDIFLPSVDFSRTTLPKKHPPVELAMLAEAYQQVLLRLSLIKNYTIGRETLTIRDCTTMIIGKLKAHQKQTFIELLDARLGILGVALSFLSLLLLTNQRVVTISQNTPYGEIDVELLIQNWSLPTYTNTDELEIAE